MSFLPGSRAVALGAAILLVGGCDLLGIGEDDGGSGGGGGGDDAASSSSAAAGGEGGFPPERRGVAQRHDGLPPGMALTLCNDHQLCDLDPATLYLLIDETVSQCTTPLLQEEDPERWWIGLRPSEQAVGMYPLTLFGNQNGAVQPPDGSLIDVTAIDAQRIEVRTRGVFLPDSLFEIERCDTP
jgi:hypothetical protein